MRERVTDERLAMLLDANGIPSESKEGRALSTGIMLDLRDCRAALAEAQGQVAALRADLIAQIGPDYDCPACDRGVLRQRVDGREPEHWDDCPAARAVATLLDTAAAATAHDERVRAEGVLAAWMDGWRQSSCPASIAKPTMDEAIAFVRAPSPDPEVKP